jgi:hypothetical protein
MADAIQTLPNTKQDIITSLVQRELKAQAKLLPFISDFSGFAGKGAQSVAVPRLSSFTAALRSFGAAHDATALTDAKDVIDLDKNRIVAWLEDHRDNYQSTIEYRMEAAKRASTAHARAVDEDIASGLIGGAFSFENATGGSALITKEDILSMRKKLLKENSEIDRMTLVIGPDNEEAMLGIAEFVRADAYGSSNIPSGVIGRVYGVDVVVTNVSTMGATQAVMFDREGYGIAFQEGVQMSEQNANEYGALSKRVAVDQLYGLDILQEEVGSAAAGKSPLIVKLNEDND